MPNISKKVIVEIGYSTTNLHVKIQPKCCFGRLTTRSKYTPLCLGQVLEQFLGKKCQLGNVQYSGSNFFQSKSPLQSTPTTGEAKSICKIFISSFSLDFHDFSANLTISLQSVSDLTVVPKQTVRFCSILIHIVSRIWAS